MFLNDQIENLDVRKGKGYGQYVVTAEVSGVYVKAHTTDSEIFDWLHDDMNEEKHQQAIDSARYLVTNAYEELINNL